MNDVSYLSFLAAAAVFFPATAYGLFVKRRRVEALTVAVVASLVAVAALSMGEEWLGAGIWAFNVAAQCALIAYERYMMRGER